MKVYVPILMFLISSCSFFGGSKTIPKGNYQVICGYTEKSYLEHKREDINSIDCRIACEFPAYHRSFLSLKDDHHYVLAIDDVLLHGQYTFDDDKIILEDENNESFPLEIMQTEVGFVQLKGNFSNYNSIRLPNSGKLYINFALDETAEREKPSKFDLVINEWRHIPTQLENEQQIKQRVLNFLDYSIAYFQHISNSGIHNDYKIDAIESPIIYGSNGIALKEWADIPLFWKELYFNDNNARVAYDYLSKGFKKGERMEYGIKGSLLVSYYLKDLRNTLSTLQ